MNPNSAIQNIISMLNSDASLQTLLGGTASDKRVYPNRNHKARSYPCITYEEFDAAFDVGVTGGYTSIIRFYIHSKDSYLDVRSIYEKLNELLNYYVSVPNTIRYLKQTNTQNINNPNDLRLYQMFVDYQIWAKI